MKDEPDTPSDNEPADDGASRNEPESDWVALSRSITARYGKVLEKLAD